MYGINQKGIAHLFLLIPLIAGIILGVYLINQKTNLFPWAASNPVSGPVSPSPSFSSSPSSSPQSPKSFGKAISLLTGSSTQDLYLAITRLTNQYDDLLLKDPFTVEYWFRINKLPDQQLVLLSQSNRLNVILKNNGAGTVVFQITTGNGTQNQTTSWATGSFAINEWHHFATMYKNGNITLFMDGKYIAHYATAYTDDRSEIIGIGKASAGIVEDLDEVRISNVSRYPAPVGPGTYQVPVAPFEADGNTQVLFHMDGSLAYADGTGNYRGDITGGNNGITKYIDSINTTNPSPSVISGPINPSPSPRKPGDADGDNDVDIFDYNIVLTDFAKNILPGKPADFDKDGDVDIFDYNIILTYFGT